MNVKIMVNWDTKKVVHTEDHAGSKSYQELLARGYTKVGVIKPPEVHFTAPKFYWEPEYFEPAAKYIEP
jgi:hypothetical protein